MSELADLVKMLKKNESSGSDYTGTVTRVEDGVAYVQLSGADIKDTPASMSISAKPGDKVRVRIAHGKAWLTGNDTAPPTYDVKNIDKISQMVGKQEKSLKSVEDHLNEMGTIYSASGTVSKNANGQYTAVDTSLKLQPGKYILKAEGMISKTASASMLGLIIAPDRADPLMSLMFNVGRSEQYCPAAITQQTVLNATAFVNVEFERSYYVMVKNGNVSAGLSGKLEAIRIG